MTDPQTTVGGKIADVDALGHTEKFARFLETRTGQALSVLAPASAIGTACTLLGIEGQRAAVVTTLGSLLVYTLSHPKVVDRVFRASHIVALLLALVLLPIAFAGSLGATIVERLFEYTLLGHSGGIIDFRARANDFIPELTRRIGHARNDITFVGVSFYITAIERKEDLVKKLRDGITVRFLIFDVTAPTRGEVAAGFSQPEGGFARQCVDTIEALRAIAESSKEEARGNFEVRLFRSDPRTRLYIIDRNSESGVTFFVPHVDNKDSVNLPGFLALNTKDGVSSQYIEGADLLWRRAIPWEDWLPEYDKWKQSEDAKRLLVQ